MGQAGTSYVMDNRTGNIYAAIPATTGHHAQYVANGQQLQYAQQQQQQQYLAMGQPQQHAQQHHLFMAQAQQNGSTASTPDESMQGMQLPVLTADDGAKQ